MSCDRVIPLLSPFLDGELDARGESAVRDHLARCDRCSSRLEALAGMRSAVRSTRPEPSDQGLEALRRRLLRDLGRAPEPVARRRGLWAGLAAGLALLAAGSVWLSVDRLGPEPTSETAPAPMSVSRPPRCPRPSSPIPRPLAGGRRSVGRARARSGRRCPSDRADRAAAANLRGAFVTTGPTIELLQRRSG